MTEHTGRNATRRRRDGGLPFVMVPTLLIGRVSPAALATYCAIGAYTSARDGTAWPGQRRLAADLACSTRTVQRCCDELTEAGVLEVEPTFRADGGRAENVYRVVPLGPVDKAVD